MYIGRGSRPIMGRIVPRSARLIRRRIGIETTVSIEIGDAQKHDGQFSVDIGPAAYLVVHCEPLERSGEGKVCWLEG